MQAPACQRCHCDRRTKAKLKWKSQCAPWYTCKCCSLMKLSFGTSQITFVEKPSSTRSESERICHLQIPPPGFVRNSKLWNQAVSTWSSQAITLDIEKILFTLSVSCTKHGNLMLLGLHITTTIAIRLRDAKSLFLLCNQLHWSPAPHWGYNGYKFTGDAKGLSHLQLPPIFTLCHYANDSRQANMQNATLGFKGKLP